MTDELVSLARSWARELPRDFARNLATALRAGPSSLQALRTTTVLAASAAALSRAIKLAEDGHGPYTAGALSALIDAETYRPTVTPVWTGPASTKPGDRLTLAVIADLIDEAKEELLLVSYATYPDERVRGALDEAVARNVKITTLLERPADNPGFDGHATPFAHLAAKRLSWPAHDRPAGAAMHAKVLVIDRTTALVGSANLTGHGLERNLECGLLIRGGPTPRAIAEHLLHLPSLRELP